MNPPAAAAQRPTHARYWVIVFAVVLAIISYIDRVTLSHAKAYIQPALGLKDWQMGWIFGSFALAYALFEIPGGWMGDWLGPRRVLLRIVLWWSTFTALLGRMWNFPSFCVCQFLFGAGEAGGFPNIAKAFSVWLPHRERVRAQGIVWTFARWGGAFTAPLVLFTLEHVDWRWAFFLFALPGFVWAALFHRWFRDNPRDHPGVNQAELALLGDAPKSASGHGNVPWDKLIRSRSVVLLWVQYFCLSFPWYFYITWLPTYLEKYRHLTRGQIKIYGIVPLFCGGLGSLVSGTIALKMAKWTGSVRMGRRVMACTGFLGAAVLLVISINLKDPMWAMAAMGTASFFNDLVMPPAWGSCMDVGGKFAGTVAGSMNMMGNLAGFCAPVLGGFLLPNWNALLYTMAVVYLLGTFCWPFIDPVTPMEQGGD
jgi:ACS family glucarate transporter-like MFS transporter